MQYIECKDTPDKPPSNRKYGSTKQVPSICQCISDIFQRRTQIRDILAIASVNSNYHFVLFFFFLFFLLSVFVCFVAGKKKKKYILTIIYCRMQGKQKKKRKKNNKQTNTLWSFSSFQRQKRLKNCSKRSRSLCWKNLFTSYFRVQKMCVFFFVLCFLSDFSSLL